MAEEKLNPATISSDDTSVLRVLLHNICGIIPVPTAEFVIVPIEEE